MDSHISLSQTNGGRSTYAKPAPIVPVILSGGAGSRLWPLSRADMPKQLLQLYGTEPMIVSTVRRRTGADSEPPIIACGVDQEFLVVSALAKQEIEVGSLVLEPMGKNTAPAVAVAALRAALISPDAVLVVQPADHVVADPDAFRTAVEQAYRVATCHDRIVLLGVRPARAETGYGYIECGEPLDDGVSATLVKQFIEKPDAERAERFARSGMWLWNVGIFVFTARAILEEFARLRPAILDRCRSALAQAKSNGSTLRLDRESFAGVESISIDHAIMEKSDRLAVVRLESDWTDIGSWSALWDIQSRDHEGNVIVGDVECLDTQGSYLRTDGRLLVSLGLRDAVVVSTPDAVLVADKRRSQDIKAIVEGLRGRGRREVQESARCRRPWGSYETVSMGDGFRVKRIVVDPGAQLSLQLHHHRSEHWVIVGGTALVRVNDKTELRRENQAVFIPVGAKHRVANVGNTPLELIEVQVGSYLGEDDIVRFEDSYGRA
jgi:mannose-1-phosphate guanylyltransferase / mannose-6-phosphate isomerase